MLNYEDGKKLLKIWNDNSTQNLMFLFRKYSGWMENGFRSTGGFEFTKEEMDQFDKEKSKLKSKEHANNMNDKHFYRYILKFMKNEFPLHIEFCVYFVENILKFTYAHPCVETAYERALIFDCFTKSGTKPVIDQEIRINPRSYVFCFVTFLFFFFSFSFFFLHHG